MMVYFPVAVRDCHVIFIRNKKSTQETLVYDVFPNFLFLTLIDQQFLTATCVLIPIFRVPISAAPACTSVYYNLESDNWEYDGVNGWINLLALDKSGLKPSRVFLLYISCALGCASLHVFTKKKKVSSESWINVLMKYIPIYIYIL